MLASEWKNRLGRAVAEFLVIFLGVSLSFVAEDWRERRGEQREAEQSLAGILSDLEQDIPSAELLMALDSTSSSAGMWLHQNWDRPTLPEDTLNWALAQLHHGGLYAPVRAEYESAKANGRLAEIDPEELRSAIVLLHENVQPFVVGVGEIRLDFGLQLWPLMRPYESYAPNFSGNTIDGGGVVPEVSLAVPWSVVQGDRELRNAIVDAAGFRRLNAQRLAWYVEQAVAVRDSIQARLSR